MLLEDSVEESDVIEHELRALPLDIRSIIETERGANQLRLDVGLGLAVVSVPHFLAENFQNFRAWRESGFRSSTFRLADLLEMLPGQANFERAIFRVQDLRGLEH